MLVTAGGASANAITGVISAWADSIPGIVISGQENLKYVNKYKKNKLRMGYTRIWTTKKWLRMLPNTRKE